MIPNHDHEDLRNILDDRSKTKFKAVTELQPQTLTTEHKPEQMQEWKGVFEQWFESRNFVSTTPSVQFGFFTRTIDESVKTRLAIDMEFVRDQKVHLYREHAEKEGVPVEESVWYQLDFLFGQLQNKVRSF